MQSLTYKSNTWSKLKNYNILVCVMKLYLYNSISMNIIPLINRRVQLRHQLQLGLAAMSSRYITEELWSLWELVPACRLLILLWALMGGASAGEGGRTSERAGERATGWSNKPSCSQCVANRRWLIWWRSSASLMVERIIWWQPQYVEMAIAISETRNKNVGGGAEVKSRDTKNKQH